LSSKEKNKDKEKLSFEEWKSLLFEYCDVHQKCPTQKTVYKNQNIGVWLQHQKNKITSTEDDVYKILSENLLVKQNLDEYLSFKEKNKDKEKLSFEEWKTLLFEYCELHQKCPIYKTVYKNQNIAEWLTTQKKKITSSEDHVYKILSENLLVKQNLDEYLSFKEKNKDKEKLSFEEWKSLLFEYCDEHQKCPANKTVYKNQHINSWFVYQKGKITTTENELYKVLSENLSVKKNLDEYLLFIEKNKDKDKLSFEEWKSLLFEYCNIHQKCPTAKTVYKNQNINTWFVNQKGKITSSEDELYKILSVNSSVKQSLDEYLSFKDKKLSFEEWEALLFEYCDVHQKFPTKNTVYKAQNIGSWLSYQKNKITSSEDELYKILSENPFVKQNLDNYLLKKIQQP
jgi:hypothetical protein